MSKQIRILYAALLLFHGLMAGCSSPAENSNNASAPASPVAQGGTTPANSEAAPQPAQPSGPSLPNPGVEGSSPPLPKVSTGPAAQPAAQPAPSGPAPKLVVDAMKVNFGKQPKGKNIARNIMVRNRGTALLKIEAVEPS